MKQRDGNFDSMSNTELWDLYTELGSKLTAKLEAEAALLQQRLDELQRRAGAAAPARRKAKGGAAVAAKFRNPHPPYQPWSGRGPQPRWIKEALSDGETLDSLRIQALLPRQDREAYLA